MKIIHDDEQSLDELVKRARNDRRLQKLIRKSQNPEPEIVAGTFPPMKSCEKARMLMEGIKLLDKEEAGKKQAHKTDLAWCHLVAVADYGMGNIEKANESISIIEKLYQKKGHPKNTFYRASRAIALLCSGRKEEAQELVSETFMSSYYGGLLLRSRKDKDQFEIAPNAAMIIACTQLEAEDKESAHQMFGSIKNYEKFVQHNHIYRESEQAYTLSNALMSICENLIGDADEADYIINDLEKFGFMTPFYNADHVQALQTPYGKPDLAASAAMVIAYMVQEYRKCK
jgi:hypothetical protein